MVIQKGKHFIISAIIIVIIIELFLIAELTGALVVFDEDSLPRIVSDRVYNEIENIETAPLSIIPIEYHDVEPLSRLKPNSSLIFYGTSVWLEPTIMEINSDGYRGKLYPKKKPEGVYRIVVLGDSSTFGSGINITDTFAYLIEEMLNNGSNGTEYQVINLGVPGYGLKDYINILKVKGLGYNPDLVIIAYSVGNDLGNSTRSLELQEYVRENIQAPSDLNEEQKNLFYAVYAEEMHWREIESMSHLALKSYLHNAFDRISDMSEENGFDVLIFFWNNGRERSILVDYAESHGWDTFLPDEIIKNTEEPLCLHDLDPHPNALFNRKIAEGLYEKIRTNILDIS